MDRRRKARPAVEAMEPRQLLATIALDGSGRGVERTVSTVGKVAFVATLRHSLSGVVRIGALGTFQASGDLAGLPSITLSNARGTLLFAASGTPIAGKAHLALVGGTGAYAGDQGGAEMSIILGHEHTNTSSTRNDDSTTTIEPFSIRITPSPG